MRLWYLYVLFSFCLVGCDLLDTPGPMSRDSGIAEEAELSTGRLSWQKPDVVLNTLGDISDKKIADIGAGAGYFTFRMVKRGAEVIAIDVDPRMIDLIDLFSANLDSIEQTRVSTRLVGEDDPQLTSEEVDIAVIINTVAFIDDRSDYLTKVKDGLSADGLLMIVDFKPDVDIPTEILPAGSPLISYSDLSDDLEAAGYNLIRVNETNLLYQYIVYALP